MAHLNVFVPSNRYGKRGKPLGVDGWNEIIKAFKSHRMKGQNLLTVNAMRVAEFTSAAMREQRFRPPTCPCEVHVTFVEVDEKRDVQNVYGGGLKWVLDGLSRPRGAKYYGAGAIFDDSPTYLRNVYPHIRIDPNNPGVEIDVITIGD